MKKTATIGVFLTLFLPLFAQVSFQLRESDGVTPFDNRNIPVGTKLTVVVTSDSNDFWSGGLHLSGQYRSLGHLDAAGKDPNTLDWAGSRTTEAGPYALVMDWEDSTIQGFDLYSSDSNSAPGDWFILDYTALAPGESKIGFYNYAVSWDEPNAFAVIQQVPASDFNTDGKVNLVDFSLLSYYWQANDPCSTGWQIADLLPNGTIDINDLMLFTDDWLWGCQEPNLPDPNEGDPNEGDPNQPDPNVIEPTPDPNMIYSIVDANGYNEITIAPGDYITLYVDMTNVNDSNLWAFGIEAFISDPNLGSIDNRAYDSNNPPGPGTARILAEPNRWDIFSSWGPGIQQPEGIYLSGVSSAGAFADGHLASFVFTCLGPGDVELNLINWDSTSTSGSYLYPTLESILIHQVDPNQSMLMMSLPMSADSPQHIAPTDSLAASTESQTPEAAQEPVPLVSEQEMVQFLEDLYATDESIRQTISEEDWNEFVQSVEESY